MSGEINWGPEIRVDGVRPEWLTQADVRVALIDCGYGERPVNRDADPIAEWGWLGIRTLRLPADHPHYATETRATAPNGGEVGPEVVERMIALVEAMADRETDGGGCLDITRFLLMADAIHEALLPEPVDALEQVIADAMCGNNVQPFEVANAIRNSPAALSALENEAGR